MPRPASTVDQMATSLEGLEEGGGGWIGDLRGCVEEVGCGREIPDIGDANDGGHSRTTARLGGFRGEDQGD
jgi:hypothetical protein